MQKTLLRNLLFAPYSHTNKMKSENARRGYGNSSTQLPIHFPPFSGGSGAMANEAANQRLLYFGTCTRTIKK